MASVIAGMISRKSESKQKHEQIAQRKYNKYFSIDAVVIYVFEKTRSGNILLDILSTVKVQLKIARPICNEVIVVLLDFCYSKYYIVNLELHPFSITPFPV